MTQFYQDYRGNGSRRHSSPGVDQEGDAAGDVANRSQYDANVSTDIFARFLSDFLTLSFTYVRATLSSSNKTSFIGERFIIRTQSTGGSLLLARYLLFVLASRLAKVKAAVILVCSFNDKDDLNVFTRLRLCVFGFSL